MPQSSVKHKIKTSEYLLILTQDSESESVSHSSFIESLQLMNQANCGSGSWLFQDFKSESINDSGLKIVWWESVNFIEIIGPESLQLSCWWIRQIVEVEAGYFRTPNLSQSMTHYSKSESGSQSILLKLLDLSLFSCLVDESGKLWRWKLVITLFCSFSYR